MESARECQPEMIRFSHVIVQYPDVRANDDISLTIRRGEVFALVGENGAGKSTLMNVLFGLQKPAVGEVWIQGVQTTAQHRPELAMRMGVSMVHQHFKLVPSFTVAQNIMLGDEPKKSGFLYDMAKADETVRTLADTYGLAVNPSDIVGELSVGLQQRVEILKALRHGADVLILDEPTAVLTPQEAEELFEVIRRMVQERHMTVILITHKLPEVMRISNRVGVLRRGKLEGVVDTASTNERELASLMVGRDVIFDDLRSTKAPGDAALCLSDLKALGDRGILALHDIELTVRAGEIVGVCGVEGNGQTELAECIMGMRPLLDGTVNINGQRAGHLTPGEIRKMGVSYIPEDRLRTGLSAKASIMDNLLLGSQRTAKFSFLGIHLRRGQAKKHAKQMLQEFDIRASDAGEPVSALSGGNMQKTVIAREFSFGAPVLIVSQPTRGVDIGATERIHESIIQKRNEGCAVLLLSADLDELFRLSDRLVTIFEGRITGQFDAGTVSKEEIGLYMTGGQRGGAEA